MSGHTFSGTYPSRVDLAAGDNPATIATGPELLAGLYGPSTRAWSLTTQGSIAGTTAVALAAGGDVTNTAAAVIDAVAIGVALYGATGTVTNAGAIDASDAATGAGIALRSGGTVVNQLGASSMAACMASNPATPPRSRMTD